LVHKYFIATLMTVIPLNEEIEQVERLRTFKAGEIFVDLGYRGTTMEVKAKFI